MVWRVNRKSFESSTYETVLHQMKIKSRCCCFWRRFASHPSHDKRPGSASWMWRVAAALKAVSSKGKKWRSSWPPVSPLPSSKECQVYSSTPQEWISRIRGWKCFTTSSICKTLRLWKVHNWASRMKHNPKKSVFCPATSDKINLRNDLCGKWILPPVHQVVTHCAAVTVLTCDA